MLKATAQLVLPTTIIGSLPRPAWYTTNLEAQRFRFALRNAVHREQYFDAVSSLIRDQERAGLDIVTDGDSRFDTDVAGSSWGMYPALRLSGLGELEIPGDGALGARGAGSIWRDSAEVRARPTVVAPVGRGSLDLVPIWKTAQQMTDRPVKLGTPAAEVVEQNLVNRFYRDRRELVMDVAAALNEELLDLARAGCPAIQVEAPRINRAPHHQQPDLWEPEFYVSVLERMTRGLGELTELWIHTCWGNPAAQRALSGTPSYAPVLDLLNGLPCDVLTFENADSGCADLDLICQSITDKKIAIGTTSHRSLQVETPEEVAAVVRRALRLVPPERLIITADCGFGREGMSRRHALYKMVSMVQGGNIVRRELGLPERPSRAADPRFSYASS